MNKFFVFITIFLSLSLVVTFAGDGKPVKSVPVHQAFMERAPGNFDAAEYVKTQQETFNWLMAESVPLSVDSIITIHVTEEDLDAIENHQCETCGKSAQKVRIGIVKPAGVEVAFRNLESGSAARTSEGGFVWTAAAESSKAVALRVHFTNFSLPPNAALYIYNTDGEAFGPYTDRGPGNDGDFWTNTVTGPIAYLQLRHFGPASESDLQSIRFTIADVGHIGPKFLLPFMQTLNTTEEGLNRTAVHCSYNEDCVEDASCYHGRTVMDAKKAVAYIQWVSGPWLYSCSGGLLNDTVPGSQIPYFLTANHCIRTGKDAKNLEFYWQYWTSSCRGACYDPVGAVPRTLGSDLLSHSNHKGDYSLLRLWENPPAGSVFLGWTDVPVAFSNNTEMFRISHPSGAPQAYSKHRVDTSAGACGGWPMGNWIYSRDIIGATEGGSSGSPVMNLSGQVVGQLTGGCGTNVGDVCDFVNNATVDGAFAAYYLDVKQWLDPSL